MATYNSTVSKNKPGAYRTISDAPAAAPTNSNAKYVEAGVYEERVTVGMLVGDGALQPSFVRRCRLLTKHARLAQSLFWEMGSSLRTYSLKTTRVTASKPRGVLPMGIKTPCIQFYRECDIHGTVDFTFGHAAAVFQFEAVFSTVVVMESCLDKIIQPAGWITWNGSTVTDKLFYRECNNEGQGDPRRVHCKASLLENSLIRMARLHQR